MKNNFKVYIHRNLINNKVYIGQTCNSLKQRSGKNGINYKRNSHFWNDIEKYGWDNFEHKVVYDDLSSEDANRIESELIKLYNSNDYEFGYNNNSGGGNKYADESRYCHELKINDSVNIIDGAIIKETKTANSQRKAIKQYEQKFEQVKIRLPIGSRDKIKKYVKSNDMFNSVNEMIKTLIEIEIGQALE